MSGKTRESGGFLLADLIVGIALFGVLLTGLGVSVAGFSGFNRYQWTRQQCTAAAIAQLESMTATGAPIDSEDAGRLWPRVTVSLDRTPGEGQWAGLERINVKASAQAGPRTVTVELARYVTPARQEGSL